MPIRDISVPEVSTESLRREQEQRSAGIIELMEKVEIFSPLSKPELKNPAARLKAACYAEGEVPVKQGDTGDSFYIIKSG